MNYKIYLESFRRTTGETEDVEEKVIHFFQSITEDILRQFGKAKGKKKFVQLHFKRRVQVISLPTDFTLGKREVRENDDFIQLWVFADDIVVATVIEIRTSNNFIDFYFSKNDQAIERVIDCLKEKWKIQTE